MWGVVHPDTMVNGMVSRVPDIIMCTKFYGFGDYHQSLSSHRFVEFAKMISHLLQLRRCIRPKYGRVPLEWITGLRGFAPSTLKVPDRNNQTAGVCEKRGTDQLLSPL